MAHVHVGAPNIPQDFASVVSLPGHQTEQISVVHPGLENVGTVPT
jgi:hypothetical protein